MTRRDPRSRTKGRALAGLLLSLAVSLGLLAAIMHWKEIALGDLSHHLRGADPWLVSLAFTISIVFHVLLGSHKLHLVLRAHGLAVRFRDTVGVVLGMGPLQLLLPLKGGEVAAVLYFWRHQRLPLGGASGAFIFDRGLNFVAAGVYLVAGLLLDPAGMGEIQTWPLLAASGLLLVGLLATPLHRLALAVAARLHPRLDRAARAVLEPWLRLGAARKLFFMCYSLLVVLRPVIVCHLLFAAMGAPASAARVLVVTSVAIFAGHLPGPLMGMGAREGALVGMAAGQAGGEVLALGIGLLLTLLVYFAPMLVGLPWAPALLRGILSTRDAEESAPK